MMTKEYHKYGKRMSSSSRSLALEQAYVHDVYSVIAINTSVCSPVRSHVKEFLFEEFETGSVLLDVGCSDGKYLNLKSDIVLIGLERCCEWFDNDLIKCKTNCAKQLIAGDVMYLPFRDNFFDGVLCCEILHHLTTVDRRIRALREITRTMKIGGKILLTVTGGPAVGRELQSQDVLMKLDDFQRKLNANINSSETESESSSSGYSHSHYGNTLYESCNSPNSEFGSCYSFVRKALRKFSFTGSFGSLHSRRTSVNKSRTSNSSSVSREDFPIELRNIEDEESLSAIIDSPIDYEFSSITDRTDSNRSQSNLLSSSSLLSIIKEHIISFQFQFKSKKSINNETPHKKNGFLSQHRFSLPLNFRRNDKPETNLNIINRMNTNTINESQEFASNSKPIKIDLKQMKNNKDGVIKFLQKSFSSDSLESRQASLDATGTKLIAYYSMPELHTLNECQSNEMSAKSNRMTKNKPKLLDLHPITFMKTTERIESMNSNSESITKKESKFETETENQNQNRVESDSQNESSNKCENCDQNESVDQIEEKESLLEKEEMDDCVLTNQSVPQTQSNTKFAKKLLRQRSFSADYQPEVPKAQNEQPRRFSASPNIGSTRVTQIAQYQQISIDSEESFVTIIPANRSTRESVTEAINNSDTFADFDADCLSSSTDDACCEDIIGEQTSEDNTSASSVTEVTKSTTKSVTKSDEECQSSTPSPPTTLHRYFHVFRSGELEQLIEQNVQNLHVINSYYNERATSWCVVVEKVHVWTI